MKRHKLGRKHSKKMFSRNADKTHVKNVLPRGNPMRGGIRM